MIDQKDTICHKVDECIRAVDDAVLRKKSVDLLMFTKNLHEIRHFAQSMENALKKRKKMMGEAGIEGSYQESKGHKLKKGEVNTIAGANEIKLTPTPFEVILKENGVVRYQNKIVGGIMELVESIEDMAPNGEVDGVSQSFMFGHPVTIIHAFNKMQQSLEAKKYEFMAVIKASMERFLDPKYKKEFLDFHNQMTNEKI